MSGYIEGIQSNRATFARIGDVTAVWDSTPSNCAPQTTVQWGGIGRSQSSIRVDLQYRDVALQLRQAGVALLETTEVGSDREIGFNAERLTTVTAGAGNASGSRVFGDSGSNHAVTTSPAALMAAATRAGEDVGIDVRFIITSGDGRSVEAYRADSILAVVTDAQGRTVVSVVSQRGIAAVISGRPGSEIVAELREAGIQMVQLNDGSVDTYVDPNAVSLVMDYGSETSLVQLANSYADSQIRVSLPAAAVKAALDIERPALFDLGTAATRLDRSL